VFVPLDDKMKKYLSLMFAVVKSASITDSQSFSTTQIFIQSYQANKVPIQLYQTV